MKKVAIVTIESLNYGNRLQNYALQQVLKEQKCDDETLRRNRTKTGVKEKIKKCIQNILQTKAAKFRQFDSLIEFSNITISRDNYPNGLANKFDYFIVGSDQVWNPYYDFVAGECDFLVFAKDRQKISYAASFGIDEIPKEVEDYYRRNLKAFREISVREKQGAVIVKKLIQRDVKVVLDPTFLLNGNEWKKVEKRPQCCPKNKYVFIYNLGEKNDRFKRKIELLKEKYEIFDVRLIQKNGRELPIGPSEFLFLLRNAELVLTDSFHATVFSIIFHKKFITFNRIGLNMNSRIESLAELFEQGQHLNKFGDFDFEKEANYSKIDVILDEERKKSIDFLKKAIEQK